MVLETQPLPLNEWMASAVPLWLLTLGVVAIAALVLGYVVAALLHGPGRAGEMAYRLVTTSFVDVLQTSPRRVMALMRLSIQESVRRRVLAGLMLFVLILAFALWFLQSDGRDPVTLYLSFVLTATTYLVLLLALFLSAFSLPTDIKNRTITTVVTKPVRTTEIVLGRILGFTAVGTVMLVVMGLMSYFFVIRALNHSHEIDVSDVELLSEPMVDDATGTTTASRGQTSNVRGHRHQVSLDAEGNGSTDVQQGHWHEVTASRDGDRVQYDVGPPRGQFHAREPIYGKLSFRTSTGTPSTKGINVGNEWTYRSYIEGGSLASAIWNFQGLRKEDSPDRLRLEMTIRVFRTYKGVITEGVLGSFVLRNPRTRRTSSPRNFFAKEFSIDRFDIDPNMTDSEGKPINLWDDLVDEGQLELELSCLQSSQYFGMAQPDVYLLPGESSFELNFLKGYVSIWLQMVLVIVFGVMWSTFLNGAVAMLATLATLIGGFFLEPIRALASGEMVGGGPIEALIRTLTQRGIMVELEDSLATTVIKLLDRFAQFALYILSRVLPDFSRLSDVDYVANGFNIPDGVLVEQTLTMLGYALPAFVFGFIFLKMRELAK